MSPRSKKRRQSPFLATAPRLLVKWPAYAAVLGALWLVFNYQALRQYFQVRALRNDNRRVVEKLEQRRSAYLDERRQLETWGFSAEKAIREQLLMVKPGENVIFIVGQDQPELRPLLPDLEP